MTVPRANLPIIEALAKLPVDLWRLSVGQYHDMIKSGILTDDDPVELLGGFLVAKMPKNPPHRAANRLVRVALERVVPETWYVDTQEPVTLPESEPEPDVVVVRGDTRQYLDRHPGPQDLALVVEVSDATLERDQTVKKSLYALAQIPIYWIVNLVANRLEVYTEPSGPAEGSDFGRHRSFGPDDEVPVVIEGAEVGRIKVRDILP